MDKLAINGGTPIRTQPWPRWPVWNQEEENALLAVLHSGNWWRHSYGEGIELAEDQDTSLSAVVRFQKEFARLHGCKYGIAASNGTVTLEIALRSAGIRPGDEVIVPPYTYIATASSVLMVGAVPVFVDIEADTYNLDPKKIQEAITDRTRAIIPVHFGGQPCDMDAIRQIAEQHNLVVIEDAAHAHGSTYKGKPAGSLANLGSFSFQNSKPMTAGEGGIITTNNQMYAEACESLVWAGRKTGQPWYRHFVLASNARMTEFQGAILGIQLRRVQAQTHLRMKNAAILNQFLSEIEGIQPLATRAFTTDHTYHVYMFRYSPEAFGCLPKEKFTAALQAEGITGVMGGYTQPLYQNPMFLEKNFMGGPYPVVPSIYPKTIEYRDFVERCPVAEKACAHEAIWVLMPMLMGDEKDLQDISSAIHKIKENVGQLL